MTPSKPSLLPHDLLIDSGRVNRPPLRAWAVTLLGRIEALEPDVARPERWTSLSGCLNNASLIEVYRGNYRQAKELCELQIECGENLIRFRDPVVFADYILQPWINLGRLLRLQGQFERSLDYFAVFLEALSGGAPALWPLKIDLSSWKRHAQADSVRSFVQSVYIADSTKTYLSARNPEGALEFIRRARSLPGSDASPLLDESELITLAKLGRHQEALAVTERPIWQGEAFSKLLKVTYRIALQAESGEVEPARQLAAQLAERVLKTDWSVPQDHRILRYLQYLGRIVQGLGLHEPAARIFRAGLGATRSMVDVPLSLSFLESLLELGDPQEREALEAERLSLLKESLYVSLLKPRGFTLDPEAAADPVFDQVRHQLERVVMTSVPSPRPGTAEVGLPGVAQDVLSRASDTRSSPT